MSLTAEQLVHEFCYLKHAHVRVAADMQDNQSVTVVDPTERVVKAIVYIHDCDANGGANGAVIGTHRLPYSIAEVYGKQFYNGNEVHVTILYCHSFQSISSGRVVHVPPGCTII